MSNLRYVIPVERVEKSGRGLSGTETPSCEAIPPEFRQSFTMRISF